MWFKKWCDRFAKRLGYVPVSSDTVSSSQKVLVQLASVRALSCRACSGAYKNETNKIVKKLDSAAAELSNVFRDNWPEAYRAFMLHKQLNT